MKVPFFRLKLTQSEARAVQKVVRSGWLTTGPAVAEFETGLARLVGARHAVALSSGSAGLHLTLAALGIGPGDEVITTPFTMAATLEAILYCGATPILADIDPVTLNIDPAAVAKKVGRRTRAILTVDIAGQPCDYRALKRLAREHRLYLIDDAAHALGARYRGRSIGAVADATIFSFYSTKNITTGEGGAVVTPKKALADRIRHLSLHGMTSSGWKRHHGGSWRYDITELGHKYNMSDLNAGLGLGQLERFEAMQECRRRLAARYREKLAGFGEYIELPADDDRVRSAWHLFIVKLQSDRWRVDRDRLIDELEKRGVGCGVHFIPVYHFSLFKKLLKCRASDFPTCEAAFRRVITLPFYHDLTYREIDYVAAVFGRLIKQFGK